MLPAVVDRLTSKVEGGLRAGEGRLLYRLAEEADAGGCIVEIGSWQGKSTIWLAASARVPLFTIDPHTETSTHAQGQNTEAVLRRNLAAARVSDRVEVIVSTSEEAVVGWERPISLLWIDGDHSYEGVRRDYLLWGGYVANGGVIAFHDTFTTPGPARFVSEFIVGSKRWTGVGHAGEITFARRQDESGPIDLLWRRFEVLKHAVYGLRVRAGLPTNVYFFVRSHNRVFQALRAMKAQLKR